MAKKPPPAPQQHPPPPAPHPQQHPPQHPQNQAHGKGGHRGGKSSSAAAAAAASSSAPCSRRLGRVLNFLFYSPWRGGRLLGAGVSTTSWSEVQHVRRSHQDFSRQREELGQACRASSRRWVPRPPTAVLPAAAAPAPTARPLVPSRRGPRRPRPGVLCQPPGVPSPRPLAPRQPLRPSLLMAAEESPRRDGPLRGCSGCLGGWAKGLSQDISGDL